MVPHVHRNRHAVTLLTGDGEKGAGGGGGGGDGEGRIYTCRYTVTTRISDSCINGWAVMRARAILMFSH